MEVCCSNRHAFDHDFQNISVSAEVRRSIFQILYCVGLDKSGVLHPTVVIDIVLFEKVRLGLNTDSVCFHLLIAVSIPVNFIPCLLVRRYSHSLSKYFNTSIDLDSLFPIITPLFKSFYYELKYNKKTKKMQIIRVSKSLVHAEMYSNMFVTF